MSTEPKPSDPPDPPPRSRTGDVLREATGVGRFFANLTPAQLQAIVLVFMTLFVCAMAAFILMKGQQQVVEREAAQYRNAETRDELMKQHCQSESRELRNYFAERDRERTKADADRDDRRMKFEAEERAKDRQSRAAEIIEYGKWREMLGPILRKLPENVNVIDELKAFRLLRELHLP